MSDTRGRLLATCVLLLCGISLVLGAKSDAYLYDYTFDGILAHHNNTANVYEPGVIGVWNGANQKLQNFQPCHKRQPLATYHRQHRVLEPGPGCADGVLEYTADPLWPGIPGVQRWHPLTQMLQFSTVHGVDPDRLPGTLYLEVRCRITADPPSGTRWRARNAVFQSVIPSTDYTVTNNPTPDRKIRNVVSIKFDALSRTAAMTYMPRFVKWLKAMNAQPADERKWRAFTMGSYHVLGHNTQVNEVPYLTGQSHTRQPFTNDHGFFPFGDDYTWIWDEYRRAGYKIGYGSQHAINMMGYCLGLPDVADRFDYLFRGQDCYMKTCANFNILNVDPSTPLCSGNVPIGVEFIRYIADAVKDATAAGAGVAFFTDFLETHNCNSPMTAAHVEDAALEAVAQLMEARDDTLLVVYGDHGQHYGKLYNTPWGRVDHRLPLLQVLAPQWWLDEHPDTEAALDANQHEIVTMYDLHATLRHLLTHPTSFSEVGPGIIETMDNPHARSLLDPVRTHPDAYRTCGEAGLDHASCVLSPGSMKVILTPPAIMVDIIEAVVDHVNGHTASHRSPADRPGDGCLEVFIEGDIISGFINGMVRAGATGDIYDVNVRIQPYACTFGAVVEVAHDGLITVHSVAHTSPYAKFETCFAKAEGVPSGMCLCQFPGGPVPASKQDK